MTYLHQNLWASLGFLAGVSLLQLLWLTLTGMRPCDLTLRRGLRILVRSALAFLAYILLGAALPNARTPQLSGPERAALPAPESFYGSTPLSQRVALIADNREALEMRLRMINAAEESLILTTFSIHGDDSGTDLCAALLEAADRGVQVGILTDGYDAMTNNDGKEPFSSLAAHPNIDFHVYAPGSVLRPGKAMARMHEKYMIADGERLLLGGRNCHDYFLGDAPAAIHNIDLDLMVCGSGGVIDALTARYRAVLALEDTKLLRASTDPAAIEAAYTALRERSARLRDLYPALLQPYDYTARTVPCNRISLIASSIEPTAKRPTVWQILCDLMEDAGQEVLVHSPYLVCSREMKADLTRIAEKTDLRITLNSPDTSANLFGSAVYLNDKQNLLDTGAALLEYYGGRSSHTKAICIDERLAVVGSFNFDMRSAYIDSELMLAVDSPALAAQLKRFMTAVETCAAPAEAPPALDTAPTRDILVGLLRLVERPFRHLL